MKVESKPVAAKALKPTGYDDWLIDMTAVADDGEVKLREAWTASKPQYRAYITKHSPNVWASLKNRALKVKA